MVRLECTEGTHNKYYTIGDPIEQGPRSRFLVVITYGRINRTTTEIEEEFETQWAANQFIEEKIEEKLRKGYHRVSDDRRSSGSLPSRISDVWNDRHSSHYQEAPDAETRPKKKVAKKKVPKKVVPVKPKKDNGIDVVDFDLLVG
jgi:predicted DNA-binding WGR domain protein